MGWNRIYFESLPLSLVWLLLKREIIGWGCDLPGFYTFYELKEVWEANFFTWPIGLLSFYAYIGWFLFMFLLGNVRIIVAFFIWGDKLSIYSDDSSS